MWSPRAVTSRLVQRRAHLELQSKEENKEEKLLQDKEEKSDQLCIWLPSVRSAPICDRCIAGGVLRWTVIWTDKA